MLPAAEAQARGEEHGGRWRPTNLAKSTSVSSPVAASVGTDGGGLAALAAAWSPDDCTSLARHDSSTRSRAQSSLALPTSARASASCEQVAECALSSFSRCACAVAFLERSLSRSWRVCCSSTDRAWLSSRVSRECCAASCAFAVSSASASLRACCRQRVAATCPEKLCSSRLTRDSVFVSSMPAVLSVACTWRVSWSHCRMAASLARSLASSRLRSSSALISHISITARGTGSTSPAGAPSTGSGTRRESAWNWASSAFRSWPAACT